MLKFLRRERTKFGDVVVYEDQLQRLTNLEASGAISRQEADHRYHQLWEASKPARVPGLLRFLGLNQLGS